VVPVLVLFVCVFSQENPPSKSAPANTAPLGASKKPAAKLTPAQQQGLELLKAAQTEAAGLQPDMRAFVLWQVSNAYTTRSPAKKDALLRSAFLVTQSIENNSSNPENCPVSETDPCGVKGWLQESILSKILQQSVDAAEKLLPRAEPAVRKQIGERLVEYYVGKKNFDRAEELLTAISDQKDYPYGAATDLMVALPDERAADRLTIFGQALNNFEQNGTSGAMGGQDIGTLIVRCWNHLPPGLVLEAIGKVLDEAKSDKGPPLQMSMTTEQGSISLNSTYELRLFQLLPVLEELDKETADSLLKDNAQMRSDLQRFPNGMKSVDPSAYGDPPAGKNGHSASTMTSVGIGGDAAGNAEFQAKQEAQMGIDKQKNAVISEAGTDPKQALTDALTLPLSDAYGDFYSPRVSALEAIAQSAAKKEPMIAKAALDEIVKLEDQLSQSQAQSLDKVPQSYLDLGDEEGAKKALKGLLKIAEKLYTRDNDPDDPNLAFKGTWPSTNLWRKCVQIAGKISPDLAQEIIAGISDPEIETFQKVAYATSLLGVPGLPTSIAERHKNGSSSVTTVD
jgi:hypothetical protein